MRGISFFRPRTELGLQGGLIAVIKIKTRMIAINDLLLAENFFLFPNLPN